MRGWIENIAPKVVSLLGWCVVIGWIGYSSLGMNVFNKRVPWPDTMTDFRLIYDHSRSIVETHQYYPQHSYPPSAIVMHDGLAQWPFPTAAAMYLVLNGTAAVACWILLSRMLGNHKGFVVALAYVATSSFFHWELKSQNCNILFLSLLIGSLAALHRERPGIAGFLLAASVSLKLFSVFVIPYLLWTSRSKAFLSTCLFLVLFWLILPLAVFGTDGFIPVYRGWLTEFQRNTQNGPDLHHPILVSLHNSAAYLGNHGYRFTHLIVPIGTVAWFVLGLIGAALAWFRRTDRSSTGLLADVGLLVLGPVCISPYLEPYHPVAYALPAMLLASTIFDPNRSPARRVTVGLIFALCIVLALNPTAKELRGLIVNIYCMLATSTCITLAWRDWQTQQWTGTDRRQTSRKSIAPFLSFQPTPST